MIDFTQAFQPIPQKKKYTNIKSDKDILNQLLASYGITIQGYTESPRIIQYKATLPITANVNKLLKLESNARIALNCNDVHMKVFGNQLIIEKSGIENIVVLRQMYTDSFNDGTGLKLIMGSDTSNARIITDLQKQPHMLVAGTTGSGKSMFLHQIIISLLLRNPDLQIIAVDTKQVEFNAYKSLSNFRYITEASDAAASLNGLVEVMEHRYKIFSEKGYRDIDHANASGYNISPIVFIVDEFADLIMHKDYTKVIEESVVRLAQKARAAGIHLVIATQRPTREVLTGLIKANIPSRVCFHVNSSMESRIVMDCTGGENLLGKGDMLYKSNGSFEPIRIQACYITPEEMKSFVNLINASKAPKPLTRDDLYTEESKKDHSPDELNEYKFTELDVYKAMANKILAEEEEPTIKSRITGLFKKMKRS